MKNKFTALLIMLLLSCTFFNCKEENELSQSVFEQAVFYEIFPDLLDALYFDIRLTPPPPPTLEVLKEMGITGDDSMYNSQAWEKWEKSEEYQKVLKERNVLIEAIKRDTTSIYIAIQDSASVIEKQDIAELMKHFENENLKIDSIASPEVFQIDLSKLEPINKKIKFKYQSTFPKGRKFWRTEYDFNLVASIGFSNIQFDESRSFGVLNAGCTRGFLNGHGGLVFIKKDKNNRWVIDKIVGTWIS